MSKQDIELRSEEIQDMLTSIPHWMIRWGNVVIFLLLLIILFMSWIIKYPDIVNAEIIITTQTPPEKLIARSSGRIEKILVSNQQLVEKNTPLAIIENTANYEDVFRLKVISDNLQLSQDKFVFPFEKLRGLQLGDISSSFAIFEKDYLAFSLNSSLHPFDIQGKAQNYEFIQTKQRLTLLMEQKDIADKETTIKKAELERYRKLHDKGVIATQEWEVKNLEYLQFEKSLRNLISSISQTKSSLNDLDRSSKTNEINETVEDVTLFRNAVQSFSQLKKAIRDWEKAFVLRSSIAGEVSFLQIWQENQTITAGDNVFVVIQKNDYDYIGKMVATPQNAGKIKKGQKVHIHLSNYPDSEFGILKGKIVYISSAPDKDGKLSIDVVLPDKLETSYHKKIAFQQEMSGSADIITDDLRLIERLLYQFREVFNRESRKGSV